MPVFFCLISALSSYLTDKYFGIVWGYPQETSQKSIFWTASLKVLVSFYICKYLTEKYLDINWGYHPLQEPAPNGHPKIQFFERLNLEECQFFFISRYLLDKYFAVLWGVTPPRDSPNKPKNQFFERLSLWRKFFKYQITFKRQLFWHNVGLPPPLHKNHSPNGPPKIIFWTV